MSDLFNSIWKSGHVERVEVTIKTKVSIWACSKRGCTVKAPGIPSTILLEVTGSPDSTYYMTQNEHPPHGWSMDCGGLCPDCSKEYKESVWSTRRY